jgi:hypothetical protein
MLNTPLKFMRSAIVTMSIFAGSLPAFAEVLHFKAELKAGEEIPPTTSKGTGELKAEFDTVSKKLKWDVTYSDLTGPATAAHFHGPADIGQTAGVEVKVPIEASPISGSEVLTDQQAKDLLDGKLYFNIHTAANKGGEIRGQVLKGL